MRILYTVTENADSRNASKLEKARQLEMIREAKRVEMETKEAEKMEKLNSKKKEIKHNKRKGKKSDSSAGAGAGALGPEFDLGDKAGRKKVSFA